MNTTSQTPTCICARLTGIPCDRCRTPRTPRTHAQVIADLRRQLATPA